MGMMEMAPDSDYKSYWTVDRRLISMLGITSEEEKILVLNKLIEFSKVAAKEVRIISCVSYRLWFIFGLLIHKSYSVSFT